MIKKTLKTVILILVISNLYSLNDDIFLIDKIKTITIKAKLDLESLRPDQKPGAIPQHDISQEIGQIGFDINDPTNGIFLPFQINNLKLLLNLSYLFFYKKISEGIPNQIDNDYKTDIKIFKFEIYSKYDTYYFNVS
ncbi:MAG TPA: hypothetical protein PKW55_07100 [Spirochaetota bacterium]|nr:hypothetical protein [Spirochaetota bacterium]HOM38717.1 hypothetical protein [Spirochaetota bacterium]HPQ49514.1 hypothetical protein [Spirochaetota bacterium]